VRSRTLLTWLAFVALYTAIALWCFRPIAWRPLDTIPGIEVRNVASLSMQADIYQVLWILAAGTRQLITNPAHPFDAPAFYPEARALTFAEHLFGHQLLFAPGFLASGNPVLALNLSVVASMVLLAIGIHLLIRRWGGGHAAAVLGAVLVLCAPRRVGGGAFLVHTLWQYYMPFALLFFDRYLERRRWPDLALGVSALVLQTLTTYYVGYAALIMVGVFLLWHLRQSPGAVLRSAVGIGLGIVVIAAVSYPYLVTFRQLGEPAATGWAGLGMLFGTPAYITWHAVGVLPVLGTLLLLALRRRRPELVRPAPCGALLAIAGVGYLLALGPTILVPRKPLEALAAIWDLLTIADVAVLAPRTAARAADAVRVPMPYALLALVVPGFAMLRGSGRFGVLPATLLPITAALGAGYLGTLLRARNLLPLALAAFVLVRVPPIPVHEVEVNGRVPPAYEWLRAHGGGRPLLDAPYVEGVPGIYTNCRAMYFSIYHRLPLLNGYGSHVPKRFADRVPVMARLPDREAAMQLCAETGLKWVLVHQEGMWPANRSRWAAVPDVLRVAATFGSDVVYEVQCPGV
jgi:hypothetical protein